MAPKISVILPVWNAAETLEPAIESILSQTEEDYELIIVDDGSEDTSGEIIIRHAAADERVQSFFIPHSGICAALNTGLEHAKGQYIARMDADDISLPARLERQASYLDRNPETGLVSCLVEHRGDKKKKAGYAHYVNWINTLTSHEKISLNRFVESPLAHPSVMFRRTLVDTHGSYRYGPFPEDYELWLRWLQEGVIMNKVPENLLQWRDEPGRLSRTHPRYSVDAFYRIKAEYLARWLEKNNPFHPEVIVWGAGRTSRNRAELLTGYSIRISHYIDVDEDKIGNTVNGRPVRRAESLASPEDGFLVSYVGLRGVNKQIASFLKKRGFRQGKNYIFAA